MSWFVRHRPEGDTSAEVVAVEVDAVVVDLHQDQKQLARLRGAHAIRLGPGAD